MYKVILSEQAQQDYVFFVRSVNTNAVKKIATLLKELEEHPFTGTGKPEALRFNLTGYWSRRITAEHRIIYKVNGQTVEVMVITMRYHYDK